MFQRKIFCWINKSTNQQTNVISHYIFLLLKCCENMTLPTEIYRLKPRIVNSIAVSFCCTSIIIFILFKIETYTPVNSLRPLYKISHTFEIWRSKVPGIRLLWHLAQFIYESSRLEYLNFKSKFLPILTGESFEFWDGMPKTAYFKGSFLQGEWRFYFETFHSDST